MPYPMHVIPARAFLALPRLLPHEELLSRGVLRKWCPKPGRKVLFVSHQWLKYTEPDPDNEHFTVLQRLLAQLMMDEVAKVDGWWLRKVVFRTQAMTLSKVDLEHLDLWIDYSCMPQLGPGASTDRLLQCAKAVASIPAYVERCDLLLVLAPACRHKDSGEVCNYSSWKRRGWCRMELVCSILAKGNVQTMVCLGGDAKPNLLHPCELWGLGTGTGSFSCCARGHQLHGLPLPCDKKKVRSVLEVMLAKKVRHARALGERADQHFYAALRHAFMQDLPACPRLPSKRLPGQPVPEAGGTSEAARSTGVGRLRAQLGWQEEDEAHARATGFTLLMGAALADHASAVRQLTAAKGSRRCEVNIGLRRTFPHLPYMVKGAVPLIGAMVFGSWETCEALLEGGADPLRCMANGMDAFLAACCKGNLPNVSAWLQRFPAWDVNRTEPVLGLNAVCLSALVGSAEVGGVLRALLKAKGCLNPRKLWGGKKALLCFAASNENADAEAARFLLEQGCSVNDSWRAKRTALGVAARAMRLAGRLPHSTALEGLAELDGAMPLHFAAKRGNADLVRLLLDARAEPLKDRQGQTPLEVPGALSGGGGPPVWQLCPAGVGNAARLNTAERCPPQLEEDRKL